MRTDHYRDWSPADRDEAWRNGNDFYDPESDNRFS